MILRKVIINGKEVFEPISLEDALKVDPTVLVFTDEDEEHDYLDTLEELKEKLEEQEEIDSEEDENNDDNEDKDDNKWSFNFKFDELGDLFNTLFNKGKKKTKSSKLISTLPFLNKEDIKEVVDGILANSEEYKDLNLVAVMPFLAKEDCDRIFMKFVVENEQKNHKYIYGIAPFVSSGCLSKLVDEYISGKYQELDMSALYPFMDSLDVKRVFKYIISQKEE